VQQRSRRVIGAASESLDATVHPGSELARPLQRALRDAMWEGCGVLRDGPRLEGALRRIGELRAVAGEVDVRPSSEGYLDLALALDLRGALLVAEATVRGALQRAESRGAHQRADHPQLDPALTLGFRTRRNEEGKLETAPVPLPPVPDALRALVEEGEELHVAGRLLE
jgi:succinate dehydrogenase / fumarate reductase flavoprotein subunit